MSGEEEEEGGREEGGREEGGREEGGGGEGRKQGIKRKVYIVGKERGVRARKNNVLRNFHNYPSIQATFNNTLTTRASTVYNSDSLLNKTPVKVTSQEKGLYVRKC